MEMESSRRTSMERSRELPGLKKPRLSEDSSDRDRAANGVSSRVSSGNQPLNPRFRANEREREEREDSIRGSSSSSSSSSYQQQQELVALYKTALAELTFNSKPIITNLTIIAGENLHAAKGIAASICNNVLEVPSEQKLPSLYLLDSIVKNIGRDYIKCFAAKLPEVFCKAYKQVDSSIHPGMRHLFGTWKGVFPPAPLQIIEKELGFPPVVNGVSGTNASRSNSQTQRPAHSIHVNPKYLEARQRLQQTRAKEINSDDDGDMVTPVEDAERSDRTAITGSTKQWTDLSGKMHNIQRPQRELSNDPIYEKKGLRDIKDRQFSSIISLQRDLGVGRISERTKERDELDKSYYGVGGTASETVISRKNGFDANHSYGNFRGSAFSQTDRQLPSVHLNSTNQSVQPTSKNWKNSEEEEFMWDDMNSNSINGDCNIDKADKHASLQRDQWIPLESEQPDFLRDKLDTFPRLKPSGWEDRVPLFRDIDDNHLQPHSQWNADLRRHLETSVDMLSVGRAASGSHASSTWPQREPTVPVAGLDQMSSRFSGQPEGGAISLSSGSSTNLVSALPRPGLLSHSHPSSLGPTTNIISGSRGIFGQRRQQPLQPSSPTAHPVSFQTLQHQKLPNAIDHDHFQPAFSQMGQKPMQLPGHLNRAPHASVTQDSSPSLALNQSQKSHSLHNLQQPPSQSSQPSSTQFTQLRHHPPFLHQSQPELPLQQDQAQSQPLIHTEKPQTLSQSSGTPQLHALSGDISSINLVDVSGKSSTSDFLAAIMKSGLLPNNPTGGLQNLNIQPPLPSGPPPIKALMPSVSVVTSSSLLLQTSQGDDAPALRTPSTGLVLPPLPPGPPPSSLVTTSSQKSNSTSAVPGPFSSLLSSLVSKGIISSPATEIPTVSSAQMPKVPDRSIEFSSTASVQVPSTSDDSVIHPSSAKELSLLEPFAPSCIASLAPNATELEDLIGIDFKPEIIRELHPLVINSLFDDLKHQCDMCGLRFKFQEQLHSHSDLHTSEKSELSSSDEASRKWYSNTSHWVAGNMEPPQVPVPITSLEEVAPTSEKCEPMVLADESQSICALCGEPFEDFYSHERDEWMYKGTVYLNSSERKGDMGSMDEIKEQVPIVHAKCISSSADNRDMAENDKMD